MSNILCLTCDVTGDPEVKFFKLIWKILSRPLHFRFNFSATFIGYRDRWGALCLPPPAEGRGQARPSRAGVKKNGVRSFDRYTKLKYNVKFLEFTPNNCCPAIMDEQTLALMHSDAFSFFLYVAQETSLTSVAKFTVLREEWENYIIN